MVTFSDFFDFLGSIDWVGVLVATAALMVFGFLWYGPFFSKPWARARGLDVNESAAGMGVPLALTAVYLLVFNIGIAYLGASDDIEHALVYGLIVGVLLIGPALYSSVVWAKQKAVVFAIDIGHWVIAAAIATFVQGLFV